MGEFDLNEPINGIIHSISIYINFPKMAFILRRIFGVKQSIILLLIEAMVIIES